MGKRDRVLPLLPRAFRTRSATEQTSTIANHQPDLSSIPSASSVTAPQAVESTTTETPPNPALGLAIQRFSQGIPEAERDAFQKASKTINEGDLLSRARVCDEAHKQSSSFRPQAERISKFLNFIKRFVAGVAIGIQAYPEISSLVVGAVRIVIDLAIGFTTFFSRLSGMLCQFEDYLGPLAEYAKAPGNQILVQETVANVYSDLLNFCRRARLVFVDANGNLRKLASLRVFLRQQWEPFETTFEQIRTDVQHHLDVLLHATQASQLTVLRGSVEDAERREKANQRTSFLSWISQLDFEETHDTIFAKKHLATGNWLIQRRDFQAWFGGSSSALLWCYGKPGIGKSVLAANVLEYITRERALNKESAICFAYYNYRNSELQEASHIIAALIKQLCRKRESIPDWLLQFKNESLSPSTASKDESFISLAEDFQEIFLVIDALDECPKSKRSGVIGFVTKVMSSLPCAKVFITSRREADIVRAFESLPKIQISADDVAADIKRFVRDEVDKLKQGYHGKKLHLNSSACETRIIDTLTQKADGMYVAPFEDLVERCLPCSRFLWVNLQLENLCRISEARKDRLLEAALDALPQGLDRTYARILEHIDGQQAYMRDLALKCFSWVLYAQRPLEKKGLQHALATKAGIRDRADLDLDEIDVILEACGNLLIEEASEIHLVHFSVHEFFTNPPSDVPQGSVLARVADPSSVHAILAGDCLQYIQFGVPKGPSDDALSLWYNLYRNPLAKYAAQYFDYHVRNCNASNQGVRDLVEELLRQDESLLAAILQIRYVHDRYWPVENPTDFHPISSPVSPITIVYGTQLYEVPYLRERWAVHDLPKNALHSASSVGSSSVVERLISQGYDVNEIDDQGIRPIHFAARGGHLSIFEILVSNGADFNAQADTFGTVLQAASIGGCYGIVASLLRKGVNVNAAGGFHENALQAASSQGHLDIVKLLIQEGADVDTCFGYYGSAIQAASAGGHDAIVKLLINQDADINALGGYFASALQAASAKCHDSTVKLLIDNGADVNIQGGLYGNALIAASAWNVHRIVELLINNGADLNARGGEKGQYDSALHAAAQKGNGGIVELLVSKGADINAVGTKGDALQIASFRGHYDIVKLLLEKGANVMARAAFHGSALQAASVKGHNRIVELLISSGADVNAQGGAEYGLNTALQAASALGQDATVELLIRQGADVNTQGPYGNALQVASYSGSLDTVEFLLDEGADITANAGKYGSALQAASMRGFDDVVSLLIQRGADVNMQGAGSKYYGTALQAAAGEGHCITVNILLTAGANINARGGQYGSALQAASAQGHNHIAKLLKCREAET